MPSGKIDIEFGHKPYDLLASPAHYQHFPIPTGLTSSIPFPVITTTSLPQGTVGTPYSKQLTAIGGTGALTWTMSPSSVDALTISSSGLLSGTPTAVNATSPTFTVTDSLTRANSASLSLIVQTAAGGNRAFPQMGAYLITGSINYTTVANIACMSCVVTSNYEGYNVGPGSLNANVSGVKGKAAQVPWVNPANMKICGIRNIMEIGTSPGGYIDEYNGDVANNWFLRTAYPSGPIVASDAQPNSVNICSTTVTTAAQYGAPSGSTYRAWNAALSTSSTWPFANQLDGMYFDNFFVVADKSGDYQQNGTSQTGAATETLWQNSYVDAATQFRSAMNANGISGKSYMMWGNLARWFTSASFTPYNQVLNGGVMEGCVGATGYAWENTSWANLMNNYAKCMQYTAPFNGAGPYVIFNQQAVATNWAGMRYGICSCLLDNAYWSNQASNGTYNNITLTDEMQFYLGAPITGPNNPANGTYSSGGLTVWQNGVWRRDFTNGIALVNPRGNGARTVTLEATYYRIPQVTDTDGVNASGGDVVGATSYSMPDPNTAGTGGSGLILSRTAT